MCILERERERWLLFDGWSCQEILDQIRTASILLHSKKFMFPTWTAPTESWIFPSLLSKNRSKTQRKTAQRSSLSQTKHLKLSLCVCVCLFFSTCTKNQPKKNIQKPWVFQTWWVVEVEPLRGCRGSEYSAWRLKFWHPNSGSDRSLETHTPHI